MKVQSSALREFQFLPNHPSGPALRVQFPNGDWYIYKGATKKLYDDWLKAESKGSFFHQHIRQSLQVEREK